VWFVLGVQSRAKRTVPSGAVAVEGDAEAEVEVDGAGEGTDDGTEVEGDAEALGPHPATTRIATAATAPSRLKEPWMRVDI
jgi:hypothetical protein